MKRSSRLMAHAAALIVQSEALQKIKAGVNDDLAGTDIDGREIRTMLNELAHGNRLAGREIMELVAMNRTKLDTVATAAS